MLYRTATVGWLQKRVCVAVWGHWHGSDVFWWGRLAQSCWGTEGSGEWEDAKEQTKAGYESNPPGDSETFCEALKPANVSGHRPPGQWHQNPMEAKGRKLDYDNSEGQKLSWDSDRAKRQSEFTYNWSLNVWGHGNYTAGKEGEGGAEMRRSKWERDAGGPDQHNQEDGCSRHNLRGQGGNKKWTKIS